MCRKFYFRHLNPSCPSKETASSSVSPLDLTSTSTPLVLVSLLVLLKLILLSSRHFCNASNCTRQSAKNTSPPNLISQSFSGLSSTTVLIISSLKTKQRSSSSNTAGTSFLFKIA